MIRVAAAFRLASHSFYCTGTAKTNNSDPKLKRNAYFCTDRCQLLSTGARVLNFVDRRGDFEKWCVSLAPVVENTSSPKSSKTDEFMAVFLRKMGQPHAESSLFFCRGLVSDIRRLRSRLKHFSDLFRTRLGVTSRIVAKSCNFA